MMGCLECEEYTPNYKVELCFKACIVSTLGSILQPQTYYVLQILTYNIGNKSMIIANHFSSKDTPYTANRKYRKCKILPF